MFISFGLKKFAQENGFLVKDGYVFGLLQGYFVTFVEGLDLKIVSIACDTKDSEKITQVFTRQYMRDYRIRSYEVTPYGIKVYFKEYIPVMGRVRQFLQEFLNHLIVLGVSGDGFCTACGNTINSQLNIVFSDGIVHRVHRECIQGVFSYAENKITNRNKNAETFKGILCVFICAILTYICAFFLVDVLTTVVNESLSEKSKAISLVVGVLLEMSIMLVPALLSGRCYALLGSKYNKAALAGIVLVESFVATIVGSVYFARLSLNADVFFEILLFIGVYLTIYVSFVDIFAHYKNTRLEAEGLQIVLD